MPAEFGCAQRVARLPIFSGLAKEQVRDALRASRYESRRMIFHSSYFSACTASRFRYLPRDF